ncbi:hypothetical protein RD792_017971 [Penstemon davidsonii]|uniref:Cyclin N-terminal domain-containing protein n=1 Tax=Penstemon davidsonii TaxID=160366 RepID=A0ABR0DVS5_9LAMI|nr:hypothetical protein RD792_017971 [Penstemon davidsonii]
MSSHQQLNAQTFLFDALYCEEEHCENYVDIIEENSSYTEEPFVEFLQHNLLLDENDDDEDYLSFLLHKEQENELYPDFVKNPSLAQARGEAVEWMLKVIGYYSFSALTAVLAVNYLDKFLFKFQSHNEKPWMIQLSAVACLSLAAKVEEIEVPLLVDLQVEDCKYVFESKTIQRMEVLVLSTLEWKMNPVTPLSFLDFITKRLALKSHLCEEFLRRCNWVILSLISDCRFMSYLPSALATATMLYVISSVEPCIGVEYQDQLMGILGINKDKVEGCCRLIQEIATSVDFQSRNKRKFGSLPGSPKGVVDMSFSCDSSNDSWAISSIASVTSSPEPLSKKIKSQNPNHAIS